MRHLLLIIILTVSVICAQTAPTPVSGDGFLGSPWGAAPAAVQKTSGATSWQATPAASASFPPALGVTAFQASAPVGGYPAAVTCYFYNNQFFQATAVFNFNDLKTYDFNYNVYISVDRYYREIKKRTIPFVNDIYSLLLKKYGTKQPVFKGLDPRELFVVLDSYFSRESWNLRYHPSDYYKGIKTNGYARWDFPQSRATFAIQISPVDTLFSYSLSLTSLTLERQISHTQDSLRMIGL